MEETHYVRKNPPEDPTLTIRANENPEKFLDEVFEKVHPESNMGWPISDIFEAMGCIPAHRNYVSSAVDKLFKDGYIKVNGVASADPKATKYVITFHGRLFRRNGGYEGEKKMQEIRDSLLESDAVERKKYADRLLCATWFAGGAGMLLFLIELYKVFCLN